MIENNQDAGRDQDNNRSTNDEQMNEQNLSRDNSGRTQNINQPAESGGREEAWQGRTEDVSGQPSGYTAGDKRQDKDLTQRESDQDTSMGRDESLRGR